MDDLDAADLADRAREDEAEDARDAARYDTLAPVVADVNLSFNFEVTP